MCVLCKRQCENTKYALALSCEVKSGSCSCLGNKQNARKRWSMHKCLCVDPAGLQRKHAYPGSIVRELLYAQERCRNEVLLAVENWNKASKYANTYCKGREFCTNQDSLLDSMNMEKTNFSPLNICANRSCKIAYLLCLGLGAARTQKWMGSLGFWALGDNITSAGLGRPEKKKTSYPALLLPLHTAPGVKSSYLRCCLRTGQFSQGPKDLEEKFCN